MAQISNQQQSLELRAVVKPPNCVMTKEGHQQDALWIKCKYHLLDGNWNSYPKLQLPIITLLGNILYSTKLSFFLLRCALTLAQKKELLFSFNCRTGQSCAYSYISSKYINTCTLRSLCTDTTTAKGQK
jgi:hypothetical protein